MRIVLLSGGLDSAVACAMAARDEQVFCVVVDYGQKNRTELVMAEHLVKRHGRQGVRVSAPLPMQTGLTFGLIDRGRSLSEIGAEGDKPKAYTPGRNTLLLSIALHIAQYKQADEIWIGANKDDQNGYPDCRRAYFDAFENLTETLGRRIRIVSPFIHFTKAMVVAFGRELGVDFSLTSSCYLGTECGQCDACVLREHALRAP